MPRQQIEMMIQNAGEVFLFRRPLIPPSGHPLAGRADVRNFSNTNEFELAGRRPTARRRDPPARRVMQCRAEERFDMVTNDSQ